MHWMAAAKQCIDRGRFTDAIDHLDRGFPNRTERAESELLKAEVLEKLGRIEEAQNTAQKIYRTRELDPALRGRCEFVFSRVASAVGNFEEELQRLQKAISIGEAAGDLEHVCWAQLRLTSLIADREGPNSVSALMSRLRDNVTKLGVPSVTAALHLFVAEMGGKRGLLANAQQHTKIAERLLASSPNVWLESWTQNNFLALALLNSNHTAALSHGQAALELSRVSGARYAVGRSFGNLGILFFSQGQFERATESLTNGLAFLPTGEFAAAILETLARVYLAQGRLDLCEDTMTRMEQCVRSPRAGGRYVHRHSRITKAELLIAQGRFDEAIQSATLGIELARRSGDRYLETKLFVLRSHALDCRGDRTALTEAVEFVAPILHSETVELFGLYERTLAQALLASDHAAATRHLEHAELIFVSLGNRPEADNTKRLSLVDNPTNSADEKREEDLESSRTASSAIQNIAALLLHGDNPRLMSAEVLSILRLTGCVIAASASIHHDSDQREIVCRWGPHFEPQPDTTLSFSHSLGCDVVVEFQPRPDPESRATINAVRLLLATVRDLQLAHAEREERLTLWPVEELPADDDDAIVLGQMRALMADARKVARTRVSVLITGESGTGKEVLARAIHRFSTRADKPFVPVNCTAVPRELLESQLFGYRRGAFTGAERDSLGMIRSARDGTLFLDEIGELGLDLQPKLLRFLESGEINPLGEPGPMRVDVRILAATNANLETLVQEGRFREDLFYRLNVIRLSIPPLRERRDEISALVHHFTARAAAEFGKGRVRVSEDAMEHLLLYPWPGNIRQLQNELRRMVALAEPDSILQSEAISLPIRRATPKAARHGQPLEVAVPLHDKLNATLSRIEREMIKAALRTHDGKVEAAARALGISRKGLYLKRQRLGL